ncbi:MAG TPA: hypothetical protein VMN78_13175 [Longimicrobiales bacterium]|nr:hypothetical protein [Longimicrobiales bacterium]
MNSSAIVTFLIIGAFIWGGLALLVVTALRRERVKQSRRSDRPTES